MVFLYFVAAVLLLHEGVEQVEQLSILQQDALDAYIYGYPLVLMGITLKNMLASGATVNHFISQPKLATSASKAVVRPNVDTLYSSAWLDLNKNPVVMDIPDSEGRYYVVELLDAWTNVFASIGSRTTGTLAQSYIIAGAHWDGTLPNIQAPTNTVWVLARVQANGAEDLAESIKIQEGFSIVPFCYWRKYGFTGAENYIIKNVDKKVTQDTGVLHKMSAEDYFTNMVLQMEQNPPVIHDEVMEDKLIALGLTGGKAFRYEKLPLAVKRALEYAVANGPDVIHKAGMQYFMSHQKNGWCMLLSNIGNYGTDYMLRAIIALFLFGINCPQDAVYGLSYMDQHNQPFKGDRKYTIHFTRDNFPPVNAFWSITLYNDQGLLVENPLKRYAISPHLEDLHYEPDGSLLIEIRNTPPSGNRKANWLPAPKGDFNLTMRLYWPQDAILTGKWQPPPVLRQ